MRPAYVFLSFFFISLTNAQEVYRCDSNLIKKHLNIVVNGAIPRNYRNLDKLDSTAEYIYNVFTESADSVYYQTFEVNNRIYKNVIGLFGEETASRIVLGAHYDVCGDMPGADDNGSGVAGLLELSRMLKGKTLKHPIELVAYSLEEPPFFDTKQMGSYIHALELSKSKTDVYGMISLEMIGYFKGQRNSQTFPYNFLKAFYGSKGNFITLVTKTQSGKFSKKFMRKFKRSRQIRTKKFIGPPSVVGVDLSDHFNYWLFGFSALMITDTSFYRNPNYHKPTDTIETLDIKRLSKVVDAVYMALTGL